VTGDPLTDTPLLERTTAAVLAKQVARRPDAIALVGADGTQVTYQGVGRRSDGIASRFRRLGVSRHEKVLLFLDNHLDNVLAWLGTTVGAMVSVPINSAFKGEMLAYVINESQASVIVIEGGWIERLTAIADQLPLLQTVVVRGGNGELLPQRFTVARLEDIYDRDPQLLEPPAVWDLASMLFTSGTEGRSKGVLCPHGHAFSMACYPPLQSPGEVLLVALPLYPRRRTLGRRLQRAALWGDGSGDGPVLGLHILGAGPRLPLYHRDPDGRHARLSQLVEPT
jgi:carnitine-CoA ligase